jgi:hypothetical protein
MVKQGTDLEVHFNNRDLLYPEKEATVPRFDKKTGRKDEYLSLNESRFENIQKSPSVNSNFRRVVGTSNFTK